MAIKRTMSSEEVVQAFASRVIDEETFLWKDGMADWLPLKEVPELWDSCGVSGGVQTSGTDPSGCPYLSRVELWRRLRRFHRQRRVRHDGAGSF